MIIMIALHFISFHSFIHSFFMNNIWMNGAIFIITRSSWCLITGRQPVSVQATVVERCDMYVRSTHSDVCVCEMRHLSMKKTEYLFGWLLQQKNVYRYDPCLGCSHRWDNGQVDDFVPFVSQWCKLCMMLHHRKVFVVIGCGEKVVEIFSPKKQRRYKIKIQSNWTRYANFAACRGFTEKPFVI